VHSKGRAGKIQQFSDTAQRVVEEGKEIESMSPKCFQSTYIDAAALKEPSSLLNDIKTHSE
jgi:hypothetical protein